MQQLLYLGLSHYQHNYVVDIHLSVCGSSPETSKGVDIHSGYILSII